MARVAYSEGSSAVSVRSRIEQRRGGQLLNLDRVLLHSPPVADGWNHFLGAIRTETSIPALIREMVILRIAVLNQADYEFVAHLGPARSAGADDAWLVGLKDWEGSDAYTPEEKAVLAYTDAMTKGVVVDAAVFSEVQSRFSTCEVVEITATVAAYNAVSRFLVALEIEAEDEVEMVRT